MQNLFVLPTQKDILAWLNAWRALVCRKRFLLLRTSCALVIYPYLREPSLWKLILFIHKGIVSKRVDSVVNISKLHWDERREGLVDFLMDLFIRRLTGDL